MEFDVNKLKKSTIRLESCCMALLKLKNSCGYFCYCVLVVGGYYG